MYNMKWVIFLSSILFLSCICSSQEQVLPPAPSIGWDSLKSRIIYPVLFRRGGIEDKARVRITIDTNGTVNNLDIHTDYELIKQAIFNALEGIKWSPARYRGIARTENVFIEIDFILASLSGQHHRFIIEAEPIIIKSNVGN
jgi:hypothetical protein